MFPSSFGDLYEFLISNLPTSYYPNQHRWNAKRKLSQNISTPCRHVIALKCVFWHFLTQVGLYFAPKSSGAHFSELSWNLKSIVGWDGKGKEQSISYEGLCGKITFYNDLPTPNQTPSTGVHSYLIFLIPSY